MRREATACEPPDQPLTTRALEAPATQLRPGVVIPDWSLVDGEPARAALAAIFAILSKAVSGLDTTEDRVWRAVQEVFARSTEVPTVRRVADAARLEVDPARATLMRLDARDLVIFDPVSGEVTGAYPFTTADTGHCVTFDGRSRYAMCAIDALGIGAMCEADSSIASACASCGEPIALSTAERGRGLAALSPGPAVVWAGLEYHGNCVATSLCRVTTFFCCDAHLRQRQSKTGDRNGIRLSPREALAVGAALFAPVLAHESMNGNEQRS